MANLVRFVTGVDPRLVDDHLLSSGPSNDINQMTISQFLDVCEKKNVKDYHNLKMLLKEPYGFNSYLHKKDHVRLNDFILETRNLFKSLFLCIHQIQETKDFGEIEDLSLKYLIKDAESICTYFENKSKTGLKEILENLSPEYKREIKKERAKDMNSLLNFKPGYYKITKLIGSNVLEVEGTWFIRLKGVDEENSKKEELEKWLKKDCIVKVIPHSRSQDARIISDVWLGNTHINRQFSNYKK